MFMISSLRVPSLAYTVGRALLPNHLAETALLTTGAACTALSRSRWAACGFGAMYLLVKLLKQENSEQGSRISSLGNLIHSQHGALQSAEAAETSARKDLYRTQYQLDAAAAVNERQRTTLTEQNKAAVHSKQRITHLEADLISHKKDKEAALVQVATLTTEKGQLQSALDAANQQNQHQAQTIAYLNQTNHFLHHRLVAAATQKATLQRQAVNQATQQETQFQEFHRLWRDLTPSDKQPLKRERLEEFWINAKEKAAKQTEEEFNSIFKRSTERQLNALQRIRQLLPELPELNSRSLFEFAFAMPRAAGPGSKESLRITHILDQLSPPASRL
ncbi:MAG: hypothetical protein HY069_03855 [Chlamydiia bacterium]|nr:hypothetical protein [Chlamydiia bacterium]